MLYIHSSNPVEEIDDIHTNPKNNTQEPVPEIRLEYVKRLKKRFYTMNSITLWTCAIITVLILFSSMSHQTSVGLISMSIFAYITFKYWRINSDLKHYFSVLLRNDHIVITKKPFHPLDESLQQYPLDCVQYVYERSLGYYKGFISRGVFKEKSSGTTIAVIYFHSANGNLIDVCPSTVQAFFESQNEEKLNPVLVQYNPIQEKEKLHSYAIYEKYMLISLFLMLIMITVILSVAFTK